MRGDRTDGKDDTTGQSEEIKNLYGDNPLDYAEPTRLSMRSTGMFGGAPPGVRPHGTVVGSKSL